MTGYELAQFVLECLRDVPEEYRQGFVEQFFDELTNEYCAECYKPTTECGCKPHYYFVSRFECLTPKAR